LISSSVMFTCSCSSRSWKSKFIGASSFLRSPPGSRLWRAPLGSPRRRAHWPRPGSASSSSCLILTPGVLGLRQRDSLNFPEFARRSCGRARSVPSRAFSSRWPALNADQA
jgi:hypothetical protein